jgi:hypothetical protein
MATSTWTEHRVIHETHGEHKVLKAYLDRADAIEDVNARRRRGDKDPLAIQRVEITEVTGPLTWYGNDVPARRVPWAASGERP